MALSLEAFFKASFASLRAIRIATRDSSAIRRNAENHRVYYTTTLAAGEAVCMALNVGPQTEVRRLQDLHKRLGA